MVAVTFLAIQRDTILVRPLKKVERPSTIFCTSYGEEESLVHYGYGIQKKTKKRKIANLAN